jgi:hypothetical protein
MLNPIRRTPAYRSHLRQAVGLLAGAFAFCVSADAASLKLSDAFGRTASAGSWGSANMGGSWAVSGVANDFSVNSTNGGLVTFSSGASTSNRLAVLGTNTYENVEGTVTISWSAVPTSNSAYSAAVLRVNSSNNTFYMVRAHLTTTGDVVLGFQSVVNNTGTSIGSSQTVLTGYTAGTKLKLRFAAAGKSPTYLKAKVWRASSPEPMLWQVETTDSTAGLQVAGKCGLRAGYFSNFTNWGLQVRFDDAAFHNVAYAANIKTAVAAATAGDIIYFTGVHTNRPVTAVHGTAAAPIIVRGINATIDGTNYSTGYGFEIKHNYYWLDDFAVKNCKKGIYAETASYGRITNVDASLIGQEAFKFRRASQYWDVVRCSVDQAGMIAQDYGEGFYVGDASENWATPTTPDNSGYITFDQCFTYRLSNDGFDIKEGAHHVKIKNSVVDYINGGPAFDHPRGDAGFFLRGDNIQVINCTVKNHVNNGPGYEVGDRLAANNIRYGKNIEFKGVTGLNITGVYTKFSGGSSNIKIYDDYVRTNTGNLTGNYTLAPASTFTEMTW